MVLDASKETCDYMIMRAKTCLTQGDASYAKCWVMTANALFPHNDQIKFEAYNMCKSEGNVEEASKYLNEMMANNNGSDKQLMEEMKLIVNACRNEWQSPVGPIDLMGANYSSSAKSNPFYAKLFVSLSPQDQHKLLVKVADKTEDTMTLVNLILFILKKFPDFDKVNEYGLKLIKIMDEEEKHNPNASGFLSKKFVFDVLPIIFGEKSHIKIPENVLHAMILKSFKFYVDQTLKDGLPDQLAIEKENADVVELKILEIFELIGRKNMWTLLSEEKPSSYDLIFGEISRFVEKLRNENLGDGSAPIDLSCASSVQIDGDEKTNQQILYSTLLLFLQCLHRYVKLSANTVLIEQTITPFQEAKLVTKKRKLQYSEPEIIANNLELKQVFVVASKCIKLLIDNSALKREFKHVSEEIGLTKCCVYHSFLIDTNIYRGEHNEAHHAILRQNEQSVNLKSNLQLISVSMMKHEYDETLRYCLDTTESIRYTTCMSNETCRTHDLNFIGSNHASERILSFISLSLDDTLRYIIEVLISCLKDKIILSLKPSDTGIGHLLVLSQYNWPNHVQLFLNCMSSIRNQSKAFKTPAQVKFVYPLFFNYIFIPDILEDFMSCVEECTLELKSASATLGASMSKPTSKSMTTRGVNKGAKEEVKMALISQMKNSKTQLSNDIFIDFINKEIRTFLNFK